MDSHYEWITVLNNKAQKSKKSVDFILSGCGVLSNQIFLYWSFLNHASNSGADGSPHYSFPCSRQHLQCHHHQLSQGWWSQCTPSLGHCLYIFHIWWDSIFHLDLVSQNMFVSRCFIWIFRDSSEDEDKNYSSDSQVSQWQSCSVFSASRQPTGCC